MITSLFGLKKFGIRNPNLNHKDESWKDKMMTHLGVLKIEVLLDIWNERRIEAGVDWYTEIHT